MNLFERLIMRRLMSEAGEGGEPGGAATPGGEPAPSPAAGKESAAGTEGAKPAGEPNAEQSKEVVKTDAESVGKDKPGDDKDKKTESVPEKYEFTAPEGVKLDNEALGVFEPIAKELGLTQAQAQKLVDIYPKLQQQQADTWAKQVEQWGADAKTDKDIGGDKFEVNVGVAQKALDTFGTPELRTLLDTTGIGNHPEVIRAFMKVGKMMSEDSMVLPNNNGGQLSAAEVLYGKK